MAPLPHLSPGAHPVLGGRPPFPIETMLRIHYLQLWRNLSDPAMEEKLHEPPLYRRFAGLDCAARMPDKTTILRLRHLLEKHELAQQGLMLKTGTIVDATIIATPSSTKNKRVSEAPRCTRPGRATSGTLE